jgi:hypothetical protein
VRHEGERLGGPPEIEFGPQGVFLLHPPEASRCGAFRQWGHQEDGRQTCLAWTPVPASTQEELSILTKRLRQVVAKVHRLTGFVHESLTVRSQESAKRG